MRAICSIFVLIFATPLFANEPIEPSFTYLEIGYTHIPDEESSAWDLDGSELKLGFMLGDNFFSYISRREIETADDPVYSETWKDFALGYKYDLDQRSAIYVAGIRTKIDAVDYEDFLDQHFISKAKSLAFGYRIRFNQQFELGVEVMSRKYTFWDDSTLDKTEGFVKGTYYLSERFGFSAKFGQELERDLYQLGLQFDF